MFSVKEVKGNTILVRIDMDVPVKNNRIVDDVRLRASLPTIKLLQKKRKKIILLGHRGRPNGKVVDELRTEIIARWFQENLKTSVSYVRDCVGKEVKECAKLLKTKELLVLENVRFHKEEKENSAAFAKKLARLADAYVNDAFANMHRKHASMVAVTKYLPAYAGLHVIEEVKHLVKVVEKQKRPFIVILGGAKVSTKIGVIKHLAKKCDAILIGGAMAFTFLKALGQEVGKSLVEKGSIPEARKLLRQFKKKIILPIDTIIDTKQSVTNIPKQRKGVDIGMETAAIYAEMIRNAKTVFWNGPVGYFEGGFSKGTNTIAKALAENKGITIIGGGDTLAAAKRWVPKFTHASTGGGASLEFLEGKKLPGLTALEQAGRKK